MKQGDYRGKKDSVLPAEEEQAGQQRALYLLAGMGTRLGPFTHAIPKELLPVGEKAVIEHVVEAMEPRG